MRKLLRLSPATVIATVALFGAAGGGAWAAGGAGAKMVSISGNRLIGTNGRTLRLIGVDRSGTEY